MVRYGGLWCRSNWVGYSIAIIALLALSSCDVATSKPKQAAVVDTVVQPVVTGDAATILTEVDNRIRQTTNEVWPWLMAVGIIVLVGCGLIVSMLAMGFWLIRRWIESRSYVGQFEKILELKAKRYNGNGAKQ